MDVQESDANAIFFRKILEIRFPTISFGQSRENIILAVKLITEKATLKLSRIDDNAKDKYKLG